VESAEHTISPTATTVLCRITGGKVDEVVVVVLVVLVVVEVEDEVVVVGVVDSGTVGVRTLVTGAVHPNNRIESRNDFFVSISILC
jgi:hypothetical protein